MNKTAHGQRVISRFAHLLGALRVFAVNPPSAIVERDRLRAFPLATGLMITANEGGSKPGGVLQFHINVFS